GEVTVSHDQSAVAWNVTLASRRTEAVALCSPRGEPSLHLAETFPSLSVRRASGVIEPPPEADHNTSTPSTGTPASSNTCITILSSSVRLRSPVWLSPLTITSWLAGPGTGSSGGSSGG